MGHTAYRILVLYCYTARQLSFYGIAWGTTPDEWSPFRIRSLLGCTRNSGGCFLAQHCTAVVQFRYALGPNFLWKKPIEIETQQHIPRISSSQCQSEWSYFFGPCKKTLQQWIMKVKKGVSFIKWRNHLPTVNQGFWQPPNINLNEVDHITYVILYTFIYIYVIYIYISTSKFSWNSRFFAVFVPPSDSQDAQTSHHWSTRRSVFGECRSPVFSGRKLSRNSVVSCGVPILNRKYIFKGSNFHFNFYLKKRYKSVVTPTHFKNMLVNFISPGWKKIFETTT